jgi:hypothetical protein
VAAGLGLLADRETPRAALYGKHDIKAFCINMLVLRMKPSSGRNCQQPQHPQDKVSDLAAQLSREAQAADEARRAAAASAAEAAAARASGVSEVAAWQAESAQRKKVPNPAHQSPTRSQLPSLRCRGGFDSLGTVNPAGCSCRFATLHSA